MALQTWEFRVENMEISCPLDRTLYFCQSVFTSGWCWRNVNALIQNVFIWQVLQGPTPKCGGMPMMKRLGSKRTWSPNKGCLTSSMVRKIPLFVDRYRCMNNWTFSLAILYTVYTNQNKHDQSVLWRMIYSVQETCFQHCQSIIHYP
jgi:hypothetical protein